MSDKSIAQKLRIKEGYKVLILNAPAGYAAQMGELPPKTAVSTKPEPGADLIQLFVKSRKELETQLPPLKNVIKPGGLFWITYPKGSSKTAADINRDSIWDYANTLSMTGVAMIAIDDTWSALRVKIAENSKAKKRV
jgi:hypothetical protein